MGKKPTELQKRKEKYLPELKQLIEAFGEWEVNTLQLGKKWDIPKSTIHKWKQEILNELGPIDFKKAGRNMNMIAKTNIKWLNREIRGNNRSFEEKLKAIKILNETNKSFMDLGEQYGAKEKIADKLEVNNQIPPELKKFQETYAKTIAKNKK